MYNINAADDISRKYMGNIQILGPPWISNERTSSNERDAKNTIFTHIYHPLESLHFIYMPESVVNPQQLDTVAQLHG